MLPKKQVNDDITNVEFYSWVSYYSIVQENILRSYWISYLFLRITKDLYWAEAEKDLDFLLPPATFMRLVWFKIV